MAQCIPLDFSVDNTSCKNENIRLTASRTDALLEWDFCSGDFNYAPTASSAFAIPTAVGRPGVELVKENDRWYGFITGTWTNSLHVVEFANGLHVSPTQLVDLGNLDGMLNGPASIRVLEENGRRYALVHNTASREIVKITFGNTLFEVESVAVLTSDVGYVNSGLAIGRDDDDGWVGVVSESDNTVTIIRFGFDLHQTTSADVLKSLVVPYGNNLGDLDVISHCGDWFVAAINFGGGNTFLLSFGDNLFSLPSVQAIASLPVNNGGRLRFAVEGGEYFLSVTSLDGVWHVLRFGSDLHNNPIIENHGALGGTLPSETYGLAVAKENSLWTIFSVSQATGEVFRIQYMNHCSAKPAISAAQSPTVTYSTAGVYGISLDAIVDGERTSVVKTITIQDNVAPSASFESENNCTGSDISFYALSGSDEISQHEWDFGDDQISTDQNPTHLYSEPGDYQVVLRVTGVNGCKNFASKNLHVFPPPEASFIKPGSTLCTNTESTFINNTADIFLGNLSYAWFVDDALVSRDRNLSNTFLTEGSKTITLRTSIPGCSDESAETVTVRWGTPVDFSFAGACEQETFSFASKPAESVVSYRWDFGTGASFEGPAASYVFPEDGAFLVSLSVINDNGCETSRTKQVLVRPRPLADFSVAGPPNACTGETVLFLDESISPAEDDIVERMWAVADGAELVLSTEPQHLFSQPGTYPVSLTATTAAGCTATLEKQITIHPSPSTAFTQTPACEDMPVLFTGPSDPTIESSYWEIGTSYSYDTSPSHIFPAPGDYPLYAEFYGSNGCISTIEKTIHVPIPLTPDFSVIKNCKEHVAIFTDITPGVDPVATRVWDFGNEITATTSPATHLFDQQGPVPITLHVTTESGCAYAVTRQVEIVPAPVAEFIASPETGAYPLDVFFMNASIAADRFEWEFDDGSGQTSDEESPAYTFSTLGAFDVTLTAYNEQQCQDSFTKTITTVAPLPDADIETIKLVEQPDGSTKLIVTVHNKGNTILKNLPMSVDFAGNLSLSQTAAESIMPGAQFNFVLNNSIVNAEDLAYVCVAVDVENDLTPEGNRSCNALEMGLLVFPAYPNPATERLEIEWISPAPESVTISLVDRLGRSIVRRQLTSSAGLNRRTLHLETLPNGLYLLSIGNGSSQQIQRVTVQR